MILFLLFTKCWTWKQCCNCQQCQPKTLQSKAELSQIDIQAHKPDQGSKLYLILDVRLKLKS